MNRWAVCLTNRETCYRIVLDSKKVYTIFGEGALSKSELNQDVFIDI